MTELAHIVNLTPRDRRVILALSAVGLAPAPLIAKAFFPSDHSARERLHKLAQRGLIESISVYHRAVAGKTGHLLSLTQAGMNMATALGGISLARSTLESAAVMAEAVSVVAEIYFEVGRQVVEAGGEWSLRPANVGVDGAWALLRNTSMQTSLVLDLDLPGRNFSQVAKRIEDWKGWRSTHPSYAICYLIADAERLDRIAEKVGEVKGIHLREHPVDLARKMFKAKGTKGA